MKRLVLFFAAICCTATIFADDTIQYITFNVLAYPQAGDSVPKYNYYTNATEMAKFASVPDGVHYKVYRVGFYAADGNNFTETRFNPNTTYKMQVIVKPDDGYIFRNMVVTKNIADGGTYEKSYNWVATAGTYGIGVNFTTGETAAMIASPTFDYNGSWFNDDHTFTLSCGTEGASIYYTTDGTEPSTENGTLYTAPFTIEATGSKITIKTVAIKGEKTSEVISKTYETHFSSHNINVQSTTNGTVSVASTTAQYKSTVEVTVTPDEGYQLKAGSLRISYTENSVVKTVYLEGTSFVMPKYEVNLYAEFEEKTPTAIEQVELNSLEVRDGRIYCDGDFRIYDLVGHDVTRLNGNLRGVYVVKCADKATKVVVR